MFAARNSEARFVVWGGVHHNTLGVLRSLGEAGVSRRAIHVLLTGNNIPKRNIVSASKYAAQGGVHYFADDGEALTWLARDGVFDCEQRPVVICCSDGAAEALMSAGPNLRQRYLAPSLAIDAHEAMSKQVQAKLATDCGLSVPRTAYIEVGHKPDWDIFPCIVKPIKSTLGGGKADIKVANNKSELMEQLDAVKSDRVVLQEYIDKELEYQLIGCSLEGGKTVLIPGYTDILRQPLNTNTGYLRYAPITGFAFDRDASCRFLRALGYSGLFSLEFIRSKNGKDYFLEINLRNDGNGYCVKSAGVNLPYIWSFFQINGEMPQVQTKFEHPIYFMPELADIKLGVNEVGFARWLMQFFCARSHAVFNLRDPKPFLIAIASIICRKCRRLFERR